ncbi:MAG: fused MFS/spermidine synthase [Acidobacteria bacterium]|nr:fused MFS/spermidine synthase [Acidobacteriota bacterium]MBV9478892.1 fused MFS/spermidine synthase [Acidobacteriota bacterium]
MQSSSSRYALRIAVFVAGALLMALEVAAFRIIGKTFGAALRETTTVIAVFLAAMSAGYWAGGRAGDRWPRPETLVATLVLSALSLFTVPWLDAALSPRIAASSLALATHAFIATSVLFAIPTFLLAATSPIAIRLFTTSTGASGSTAGSISALSTAGSIAGSLATAFFLIDWLASISRTVLLVGAAALATALLVQLASAERAGTRRLALALSAAAAVIVATSVFVARSSALEQSLLRPLPNTRVLFVGDSGYHRVTVRDRARQREMLFNLGVQTRMPLNDPFGPGNAYSDALHLARLMRPQTKRVLVIGLGGGTAAKQYMHHYPDTIVDAVDVDPLVVDVAQRFFTVAPGPRLRLHVADGRTFLRRTNERWDLIILDAATTNRYGDTFPPHLATREFFTEVSTHLTPGGILHLHNGFHASKLMPALHKTVGSVYGSVLMTGGELLASDGALVIDRPALVARARENGLLAQLPNLGTAIEQLTDSKPAYGDVPLLTDDYAPVDTLLRSR